MTITVPTVTPLLGGLFGAGAIGVLLSGRREFILRWLSFFAATPVLLLAAMTGRIGAATLAAIVAVVCSWEYARMVGLDRRTLLALTAGVLGCVAAAFWHRNVPMSALLLLTVAVPVAAGRTGRGSIEAAVAGWGVAWLGGALAVLPDLGHGLLPLAVAVSVGDVAAYFGGATANRCASRSPWLASRLSPISPNKTWAGAVSGAAAAVATLAVFGHLTAVTAVAVTIGAVLGDLIESLVKRGNGVKDAAAWLPGFGGLCDRVDSLLGALLVIGILA